MKIKFLIIYVLFIYFILFYFVKGLNGWLPERLRMDLIWNRTVNLTGGESANNQINLVDEFLNKEFKGTLILCTIIACKSVL